MDQGFTQQGNLNGPTTLTGTGAVPPSATKHQGAASPVHLIGKPVTEPTAATRKLYAGEWAAFVAWCRAQLRSSLPATSETLAAYLLAAAPGFSRGTLGRRRAAIRAMHRQVGLPPPELDAASRKALRTAARPTPGSQADPVPAASSLIRIAARCPRDLAGLRDRALLLLVAAVTQCSSHGQMSAALPDTGRPDASPGANGAAGVPRLFLLALEAEDVSFTAAGAMLRLRTRSDEPAPSRVVALTRATTAGACPVLALEDWLRISDTSFGPVFRKVDRWGNVEHARLGPDAWRVILARRTGTARSRARPPSTTT